MRRRLRIARLRLGRTARRATPHARRAVIRAIDIIRVAPAAFAAILVMGVALSASSSIRDLERADVRGIVSTVGPDLSEEALIRLSGRMDPAARTLARRHDPAITRAVWGVTPGWENISLTGRPTMDALTRTGVDAQRLNAAVPVVSGALRAMPTFRFTPATDGDRRRAQRCLAQAIYYEAALEPRRGQEAVAQVILNRVRDPNFPASICGVVYQGAERTTGCQISFTCDGSLSRAPVAWAWNQAEDVARRALEGFTAAWVGTATHYHADYVRPWWSPTVTKVNQVGAHIFYRWAGRAGDTPAFRQRYSGREPVIDEARFARPRLLQVATDAAALEAAGVIEEGRTVVIDGRERQVGIVSLGGRRQAQADEIAAINERLAAFEAELEAPSRPRPDVPQLEVEEVGREPATVE